jgi:Ca-activated chloride channel family protein
LQAGLREAERWAARGYINRVLLLSDGLANRGVTDPIALERMAQRGRTRSITVSAIGVGLEYNENLMLSLANGGGGNYYYLEHAHDLASIFRRECEAMAAVVAEDCRLELELPHGVYFTDAFGWESTREGRRVSISLGDLSAGEEKEVVVEFAVDAGTGRRILVEARVDFRMERGRRGDSIALRVRHSADLAEVDRGRDWDVQAKADVAQSTRKVEQAMQALDEGRKDQAMEMLREAERAVAAAPSAARGGNSGEAMKEQGARLRSYQDVLQRNQENTPRAKKAIQYENYQVQRQ